MSTGASEQRRGLKASREAGEDAINEATQQRDVLQPESINFQALQQIAQLIGDDPLSLSPEIVQGLKSNFASDANAAARNQLAESRQGLSQGPGLRSGAARQSEQDIAVGLGNSIAGANQQLDAQAGTQRLTDLIQAFQVQQSALQQELQPEKELINTLLGGSSAIGATAANTPVSSPLSSVGGLVGTLGGAALGAPAGGLFGDK